MTNGEHHILVADIDETIVNISPKAYRILLERKELFKDYLDLESTVYHTDEEVLQRPEFNLDKLFLRDPNVPLPKELSKEFYSIFDDVNFYDDLELTPFGKSIPNLIKDKKANVDKIYLVSHCVGESQIQSKIKFLNRVYDNETKV